MGIGLIALGALAARGRLRTSEADAEAAVKRRVSAERLRNPLFGPSLARPRVTVAIVIGAPYLRWHATPLVDTAQATLIALGPACLVALAIGLRITRAPLAQGLSEGR